MHIKILKKMLSVLCVAAISFSAAPSVGAIKTSNRGLESRVYSCGSAIFSCLVCVNQQLNYLHSYKSLWRFDNLDQRQTDVAIKLLTDLKNIVEETNKLCINDATVLNFISSGINAIKAKVNLIGLKAQHTECVNNLTIKLNELRKIVNTQNKLELDASKKNEINVENLVEKLKPKMEKLLSNIKKENVCVNVGSKWKELMMTLKKRSNSKYNTDSIISKIKNLDDSVGNLLNVDLNAAEYYILNVFVQEIQIALYEAKKVQRDALASVKIPTMVSKEARKVQPKVGLIRDGQDALKNCDSTLETSMKLFKDCNKNHVKQALSSVRQLFSNGKQHPTDNATLAKVVKAWQALNEINGTKMKITNYYKVLQNRSLENECCDILCKCFENFINNGEFDLSNIKHINNKLNQAMRPIINQKLRSINNLKALTDSDLQTKWKDKIQAGRQTGALCWLFAATNARNWFKVQNGEARIYGSKHVCDEYIKNKGNSRDLNSDQDFEPIINYLNHCQLSSYIVTSDIGNDDKMAQETNRLLSEALLKKHFSANKSAVMVNKPGHWVAIAGINTQTQKALVVDSLSDSPYWTDINSLCASISNVRDPKNLKCNGLSMIFVKDDRKSSKNSAVFQNEDMSEWLNIFDDALRAASGEF